MKRIVSPVILALALLLGLAACDPATTRIDTGGERERVGYS